MPQLPQYSQKKDQGSLHETALKIEKDFVSNNNFDKLVEKEWQESHLFGGRTVFDAQSKLENRQDRSRRKGVKRQMQLF